MAIIYSYPTTTPVGADKILGVDSSDSNKTVVFTIDSILAAGSNAIVGTLTATGIGQFSGALRITEPSTTQSLLIGNQDSAGANQPGMITGTNGNLGFGYGDSWVGEGGTFAEVMSVTTTGKVGVGNASPASKLTVTAGDVEVDTVGKGFILKSPDGTRYRIAVANGGALSTSAV